MFDCCDTQATATSQEERKLTETQSLVTVLENIRVGHAAYLRSLPRSIRSEKCIGSALYLDVKGELRFQSRPVALAWEKMRQDYKSLGVNMKQRRSDPPQK